MKRSSGVGVSHWSMSPGSVRRRRHRTPGGLASKVLAHHIKVLARHMQATKPAYTKEADGAIAEGNER